MFISFKRLRSKSGYGYRYLLVPTFMLGLYIMLLTIFNSVDIPKVVKITEIPFKNLSSTIVLEMNDIREKYLTAPPSPKQLPILNYKGVWKGEITAYVHRLLGGKKNGFFIEAGANDGEYLSNTIALELLSGWSGLLVEPIPRVLELLLGRKRNAWVAGCCLSPEANATNLTMVSNRYSSLAHIPKFFTGHGNPHSYTNKYEIQCYPLHYLLMAIGQFQVDYLCLDIEGAELSVLKTIPFDKISITVINIEINNNKEAEVTKFMEESGYQKMKYITNEFAHDNVYMKKGLIASGVENFSLDTGQLSGESLEKYVGELNLDVIRDRYLTPPRRYEPFQRRLSQKVWNSSIAAFVRTLLKNKKYGFFVEAGANDGEFHSNTLSLELDDGWTGLLSEADPVQLPELLTKIRNVWVASCCLSPAPIATKVKIVPGKTQGIDKNGTATLEIQCIPLHSLLMAIGQTDVDFLSLDVGGAELLILKTIPFEQIDIKVISVATGDKDDGDRAQIQEFLAKFSFKKMEFISEIQPASIYLQSKPV